MKKKIYLVFFLLYPLILIAQPRTDAPADSINIILKNALPALTIDRPDQTDSPYTVPKGYFQLETGVQYIWDRFEADGIEYEYRSFAYPNMLLRYGLLKHVEVRLEQNYSIDRTDTETGNIYQGRSAGWYPTLLAAKIMLFEQKGWRPNIAILAKLLTPYHSRKNLQLHYKYAPGLVGAFSHVISDRFVLDGSAGGSVDQLTGKVNTTYSLSQAIGFTQKLSMFVEVFGFKPAGAKAQYGTDSGLLYMLLPNVQVDVYASKSISNDAADIFVGAGVGVRLPR